MYYRGKTTFDISEVLGREPNAVAAIRGGQDFPEIKGNVKFYQTGSGVLVVAEVLGLPVVEGKCQNDIFALHIHGGASCDGNAEDEFADAGTHYNPDGCPHPYHRGDMPPLLTAGNRAFLAFLNDRISIGEIIGKTVIIHEKYDDFSTQPSGNAGRKIACGEIKYP